MKIKRKLYSELVNWKNETQGRRALMIEGARRVGKSTIAEKFARDEYKSYILIDFNIASKRVKDNFDNLNELDVFFQNLSLEYNTRLYSRESLIIFDEIQECEEALNSLKYFRDEAPQYHIIAAGSLLGVAIKRDQMSFPVGKVNRLQLYPMSFKEFVIACGRTDLVEILRYADLYVHPAEVEIEAIACLEAIACGKVPLIADSPRSATRYFAISNRNLFHYNDPADLARKMDWWLEHPEERASCASSYLGYASRFDFQTCMDRMEEMMLEAAEVQNE